MRFSFLLSFLFLLPLLSLALPTQKAFSPQQISSVWVRSPTPLSSPPSHLLHSPSQMVHLTLFLKHSLDDEYSMEKLFWEISDPQNDNYQKYLSVEEINALLPPLPHAYDNVLSFFTNTFPPTHSHPFITTKQIRPTLSSNVIKVSLTIPQAEMVFNRNFHRYHHVDNSEKSSIFIDHLGKGKGDIQYTIPEEINKYVDVIVGLDALPERKHGMSRKNKETTITPSSSSKQTKSKNINEKSTQKRSPSASSPSVTPSSSTDIYLPSLIHSLYSIPSPSTLLPLPVPVTQGVIEWGGQDFSYPDLLLSMLIAYPNSTLGDVALPTLYGPDAYNNSNAEGGEAQLDIEIIEYVNPLALSNTFWSTNWNSSDNGFMLEWAVEYSNSPIIPDIASISYGMDEPDFCGSFQSSDCGVGWSSYTYMRRTDIEFIRIGLRGSTIIASTADNGAPSDTNIGCTLPKLYANYPGISTYVLSVGSTQMANSTYDNTINKRVCQNSSLSYQCVSSGVEMANTCQWSSYGTGGGFSAYFSRPQYQSFAVGQYLSYRGSNVIPFPNATYYNSTTRSYPDVVGLGISGFQVTQQTINNGAGGTSMATPVVAGVVSLINSYMKSYTGKPLGFFNTLLYQMWEEEPTTINDILHGNNAGTEQVCGSPCEGFYAVKGYDSVSGLGSLNFENIRKYLEANFNGKGKTTQ